MHTEYSAFVMGNSWEAGAAAVVKAAGMRTIGTTSTGIGIRHPQFNA